MIERRWNRRRPHTPPPALPAKRRGAWSFIWAGIRRVCFVIGAFVLISFILGIFSLSSGNRQQPITLPDQMVLYLPLQDGFTDMPVPPGLTDPFAPPTPGLQTQIDAIEAAAKDSRIKGLVAYMQGGNFELAHIQELRKALKIFRESGKFTYIYADSYGEAGGGLGRFYIASAFEKRWIQPLGMVSIPGARLEMPFFREALNKIGIEPQFYHRKDYKTIFESATNETMSPQNREMMTKLLGDIKGDIVSNMSADLNIPPQQFLALVDKGLFTADEAKAAGLVTDINYDDVLYEKINKDVTGDPESENLLYIDVADYAAHRHRPLKRSPKGIALVYASGIIMDSALGSGPPALGGDSVIAADELAPLIFSLAEDESVGAIVLRIDSPGGSPVASETILRAVQKAQQKGKKVVVSMGSTAASGGYWIASSADHIFASPSTLTGSIGVAGGKISVQKLWNDWGVNWDSVQWGENAGIWSLNKPFSASEAERINAMMDSVYSAFTGRVAQGRKMKPEDVERVAQGKVWTGGAAKTVGLVDEVGGLSEALDYTAVLLGGKNRLDIAIEIVPEPKTPLQRLMQMLEQGAVFENKGLNILLSQLMQPVQEVLTVLSAGPVFSYEPLKIR